MLQSNRASLIVFLCIADNIAQSSEGQSMFAMSGDSHSEDVKIPSVFLFKKEGDTLRNHAKDSINDHGIRLRVRLAGADKPSKQIFMHILSI